MQTALAVTSFVVSVIALIVSALTAVQQVRLARSANYLSLATEFLKYSISDEFLESESFLEDAVPKLDPLVGISELSEPTRTHAMRIANHYQLLGFLCSAKVLERRTVRYMVGQRAEHSWRLLAGSIEIERLKATKATGFRYFEDLAARTRAVSPEETVRKMKLRRFS